MRTNVKKDEVFSPEDLAKDASGNDDDLLENRGLMWSADWKSVGEALDGVDMLLEPFGLEVWTFECEGDSYEFVIRPRVKAGAVVARV